MMVKEKCVEIVAATVREILGDPDAGESLAISDGVPGCDHCVARCEC